MRIDAGILPDSVRFFHEPDAFTEQALYHTPHVGVYHCDSQYNFSRAGETCLDICQAIFVDHGALTVRYREQEITASPGMLILLDCREPHEYFAVSPEIRFRWFHIVGASSFAYIAHIIQSHGFVIQTAKNADIERFFAQIITDAKQDANAYVISAHVEQLLAGLASLAVETKPDAVEQSMIDSAQYIEAHYAEKEAKIPALATRRRAEHLLLSAQIQGIPRRHAASIFTIGSPARRKRAAHRNCAQHRTNRRGLRILQHIPFYYGISKEYRTDSAAISNSLEITAFLLTLSLLCDKVFIMQILYLLKASKCLRYVFQRKVYV